MSATSNNNVNNSPFGLLKKFQEGKYRVRILIRRSGGVRGILHAFITAFDSHFNMFLRDVDEAYVPLKSRRKLDNLNMSSFLTMSEEYTSKKNMHSATFENSARADASCSRTNNSSINTLDSAQRTMIRNSRRRAFFKRNHFDQLMLRGDNVILVNQASGFA